MLARRLSSSRLHGRRDERLEEAMHGHFVLL